MISLHILTSILLFFIYGEKSANTAVNYGYHIVNIYPHDPYAFTQGLIYKDGYLYESTGLRGRSTLRKVDLATGSVLQYYQLKQRYFGEGITILNSKIFQLTWQSNIGFVYTKEKFLQIDEFYYGTEGWGITTDGTNLIMSDGTSFLYYIDPETFTAIRQIQVMDQKEAIHGLNELEFIKGEIFANVLPTDRIVRINPADGRVTGWIDLKNLMRQKGANVLNGIAYDQTRDHLFVTGKLWSNLYEIELIPK